MADQAQRSNGLKGEGGRLGEAGQGWKTGVADESQAKGLAGLAPDDELADSIVDHRAAEPAAIAELGDQSVGNCRDRAVDEDDVIGRALGMAGFERSLDASNAARAIFGASSHRAL